MDLEITSIAHYAFDGSHLLPHSPLTLHGSHSHGFSLPLSPSSLNFWNVLVWLYSLQLAVPKRPEQRPQSALTYLLNSSQPKKKGSFSHNSSLKKKKKNPPKPSLDPRLILMSEQVHCDWESSN